MAKKQKRSFIPESEAKTQLKKSLKAFNYKLALKLLISFVIVFSVYQLCIQIAAKTGILLIQDITLALYTGATTVLAAAFIIMNRGVSNDIPTPEQLPRDWTDRRKKEFIENYAASKKKAKKLLIVLIPLLFTLLIDVVYLFYFN